MSYTVYGLLFGLFIPYLARRFSKFMPATPAYALYRIFKPVKSVRSEKKKANPLYQKLMRRYRMRSVGWGIVCAALSGLADAHFGTGHIVWNLAFIWTLLLLSEIDNRMFLLPDILTVPLLIAGYAFAVFAGAWAGPAESSLGAAAGYLLPVAASVFFVWKHKDVFGGGDIKLLAAAGAWLGLENILYVVILASLLFGVYSLLRRQRCGAFGPSIAAAAIMIAFYNF